VTDTYYVVAHMHYVLFGGSVFGIFAGLYLLVAQDVRTHARRASGEGSLLARVLGFNLTFFPQHLLGLLGIARRVYTYSEHGLWQTYNLISSIGSGVMAIGLLLFVVNVVQTSPRARRAVNDPWLADTLEWYTTSPPPPQNFDHCRTSRAPGRSATCGGDWRRPVSRPGPWLSLTAVFAGLSTLLAVVSGAASRWARRIACSPHSPSAALALVVAAVLAHRRLLAPSVSALVLFGIAALVTAPALHLALSAVAFAATLVLAASRIAASPRPGPRGVTTSRSRSHGSCHWLLVTGSARCSSGARLRGPARVVTMSGLGSRVGGASALTMCSIATSTADGQAHPGASLAASVAGHRARWSSACPLGLQLRAAGVARERPRRRARASSGISSPLCTGDHFRLGLIAHDAAGTIVIIGGAAGQSRPLSAWFADRDREPHAAALWFFLIVFLLDAPALLGACAAHSGATTRRPAYRLLPVVRGARERHDRFVLYSLVPGRGHVRAVSSGGRSASSISVPRSRSARPSCSWP